MKFVADHLWEIIFAAVFAIIIWFAPERHRFGKLGHLVDKFWAWVVGLLLRPFRSQRYKFFLPDRPLGITVVFSSVVAYNPTRDSGLARYKQNELLAPIYEFEKPHFRAGGNELEFLFVLYNTLSSLAGNKSFQWVFSEEMLSDTPDEKVRVIQKAHWQNNWVVMGSTAFNVITAQLQRNEAWPLTFAFPPEAGMIYDQVRKLQYKPKMIDDKLVTDFGIIARVRNPFNSEATIYLTAGILWTFQIGLARLVANESHLRSFRRALHQKLGGSPKYYEALVRVPVLGGQPAEPVEIVEARRLPTTVDRQR